VLVDLLDLLVQLIALELAYSEGDPGRIAAKKRNLP
jgi:hypothetical protein